MVSNRCPAEIRDTFTQELRREKNPKTWELNFT